VVTCVLELRERHAADAVVAGGFMIAVEDQDQRGSS
jgi:hypothetical protein